MTNTLMQRPRITLTQNDLLPDSLVLRDGSLWSHAASLGTWPYQGKQLTIDRALIEGFIRNFTAGMRRKIPVDYEHGTTNGATSTGQPVPKAGDVLELRGVYAVSDFDADPNLKAAAIRLTTRAGRRLEDAPNLGLWMRWRPTPRALRMIQDGEYSELSVAFTGDTLYAVALTNLPFLTEMLPVAAFSDNGGDPAAPGSGERTMPNPILLSVTAAVTGATVQTDEEAQTRLNAFLPDFNRMKQFAMEVGTELGEVDATKAKAKIVALKSEVADFREKAEQAEQARVDSEIAAFFKANEDRVLPAQHKALGAMLRADMKDGAKLADTETAKMIKLMAPHGVTGQVSLGDAGEKPDEDVLIDRKAKELMQSDEELKALSAREGFSEAFKRALHKAKGSLRGGN